MKKIGLLFILLITSSIVYAMDNPAIIQLFQLVKEREVNIEAVEQLLRQHPNIVNCKDTRQFAPLHYACRGKGTDIVNVLLKRGADVKSINSLGSTPLCEAAVQGDLEVVQSLITAGSEVNFANGKALQLAKQSRCGEHHAIKELLAELTEKEFQGNLPSLNPQKG